jgi:hypothetical protein
MENRDAQKPAGGGDECASVFNIVVARLYDYLPLALKVNLIAGAIVAIGLWQIVDQFEMVIWCGIVLAVSLSRFGLHYAFKHKTLDPERIPYWLNLFLIGTLCSGITWGSTAYFLDLQNQFFVVYIVGSLSVGAIFTLAGSFRAHFVFMVPAMCPIIVRLFLLDASLNMAMGVMVSLFLGMTCCAGWHYSNQIKKSLARRYEHRRSEGITEYQNDSCPKNPTPGGKNS